ncbi:hypothetical protein GIY30_13840 [Gordonia sp. HNM0687]|uniref:NRDE family protein n=1 Tax=Gordonia mangrovi TaxID=2665643 RepID=A0A6L7GS54_9ACTN|nr:NRDE family protein [Gordonia mangrovi]MXP22422.1 hypothetical protein [Gordonia mangrovi]UVF77697.1 NRDE family protein [Gordonia mangrovi]
MCLILFGWNAVPGRRLVVAANRDEFHARRTRALARWPDVPIIGGRDREAGGTWMGVHADNPSRVAMVTNVRDGTPAGAGQRSRGELPVEFLLGTMSPAAFAEELRTRAQDYAPVNVLVADADEFWWATNWPQPQVRRVPDGVHGLSNGALDSQWPKVDRGRAALSDLLVDDDPDTVDPYLEMLADRHRPVDDALPSTGIPLDRERDLSPIFIDLRGYGTRASTVLRLGDDGHGDITERRFTYRGRRRGTTTIRL